MSILLKFPRKCDSKLTSDFLQVILVPTNILWTVQISLRKKLALAGIFSLTVFIIAAAIARAVAITSYGLAIDMPLIVFCGGLESTIGLSCTDPAVPF